MARHLTPAITYTVTGFGWGWFGKPYALVRADAHLPGYKSHPPRRFVAGEVVHESVDRHGRSQVLLFELNGPTARFRGLNCLSGIEGARPCRVGEGFCIGELGDDEQSAHNVLEQALDVVEAAAGELARKGTQWSS